MPMPRLFGCGLPVLAFVTFVQARAALAVPPAAEHEPANAISFFRPAAQLDELLSLPGLSRYLATASTSGKSSIEQLRQALVQIKSYWPSELGLGLSSAGLRDADALIKLLILSSLCDGARTAGKAARVEHLKLQRALLAELPRVRLPRLQVWADFPDEVTAKQVMAMSEGWLSVVMAEWKVRPMREPSAWGVRFRLGSMFKADQLKDMLVGMNWLWARDDKQAKAMSAALAAVMVEAWVELSGRRIQLRLGERVAGQPSAMPPAPKGVNPGQMVGSGRWDTGSILQLARGWAGLWDTWKETASGRKAKQADDVDMLGMPAQIVRALQRSPESGQSWIWAERGLHLLVEEQGGQPPAPLTADPILDLLPADTVAVTVDARENLGEQLSSSFLRIEDRLGLRTLKEVLNSRGDEDTPMQRAEVSYYRHGERLRELLHVEGPSLFQGASAFLIGPGSKLKRVEIREAGRAAHTAENLHVPELAWVGRVKDEDSALGHVRQVWAALGLASSSWLGLPAHEAVLSPAPPPAKGAKAYWLDTGWFETMTRTSVVAEGDFKPSISLQGNLFVLSTSPRLSRSILNTASQRLAPPKVARPLVAWRSYPCMPTVRELGEGAKLLNKLFGASSPQQSFQTIIAPVCELVEGLSSTTEQDGDRLISRYRLPARPALYQLRQ
jgi:hypothetical protein